MGFKLYNGKIENDLGRSQRCASYSTIRFLGLLKKPDSDPNPMELTESNFVWSPTITSTSDPILPSFLMSNPLINHQRDHQLHPEKFNLSAALSDNFLPPLIWWKLYLNPLLSATSTERTISPVPLPLLGEMNDSGSGKFLQSAPVNVPVWPKWKEAPLRDYNNDDDYEAEEEILPPHEIVERSQATTFLVFKGVGRTLKGINVFFSLRSRNTL